MPRTEAQNLTIRTSLATTGGAARLVRALTLALARRRGRHSLAKLDDHMLRDIGLDPETAAAECGKPFWQP